MMHVVMEIEIHFCERLKPLLKIKLAFTLTCHWSIKSHAHVYIHVLTYVCAGMSACEVLFSYILGNT